LETVKKRLEWKAGIAITDKARAIRSKKNKKRTQINECVLLL
jgi:hypothetical protein